MHVHMQSCTYTYRHAYTHSHTHSFLNVHKRLGSEQRLQYYTRIVPCLLLYIFSAVLDVEMQMERRPVASSQPSQWAQDFLTGKPRLLAFVNHRCCRVFYLFYLRCNPVARTVMLHKCHVVFSATHPWPQFIAFPVASRDVLVRQGSLPPCPSDCCLSAPSWAWLLYHADLLPQSMGETLSLLSFTCLPCLSPHCL